MRHGIALILLAFPLGASDGWWELFRQAEPLVQSDPGRARPVLLAALRACEREPARDAMAAVTLHQLGLVSIGLDRYAEAKRYLTRSYAIRESLGRTDDRQTANALSGLGVAERMMGEFEAAERLFLDAKQLCDATGGADHPDCATILNNMALLRMDQKRYADAAQLLTAALKVWERSNPQQTMLAWANLSAMSSMLGRNDEAVRESDRAMAAAERVASKSAPVTSKLLFIRALVLKNAGRKREAQSIEYRARAMWDAYARESGLNGTVDVSAFLRR